MRVGAVKKGNGEGQRGGEGKGPGMGVGVQRGKNKNVRRKDIQAGTKNPLKGMNRGVQDGPCSTAERGFCVKGGEGISIERLARQVHTKTRCQGVWAGTTQNHTRKKKQDNKKKEKK